MFNLGKIIGLSVVAIKGEFNAKGKNIEPKYILFSDGKTYIVLEEQDPYTHHDFASGARYLFIRGNYPTPEGVQTNEEVWAMIMGYKDATEDI